VQLVVEEAAARRGGAALSVGAVLRQYLHWYVVLLRADSTVSCQ
jgi:hypothetical protein